MADGRSGAGLTLPGWRTCRIGKSVTAAPEPCDGSMKATAQLDVPRSIPTRSSRRVVMAPHVQFEFPLSGTALFQTTQFESSDLRHCGLQVDRNQPAGFSLE